MQDTGRWDGRLPGWWRRSLRLRLAAYITLAFLSASLVIALVAGRTIRQDLQRDLERQQQSVASTIAAGLNVQFVERFALLDELAVRAAESVPGGPGHLQPWLEGQSALSALFNRGVFITDRTGRAIASWPESAGRLGLNYADRDYIVAALRDGRASVGRPVIGRPLGKPVLLMAVPMRDAAGQVIGALVGVTDLGRPSFLDGLLDTEEGTSLQYHLVDGPHRLLVASTEHGRLMEPLPAVAADPTWDRLLQPVGASTELLDRGAPVFASSHPVDRIGWHLVITMPVDQAFGALDEAQQVVDLTVGSLAVLGALLIFLILGHELRPLQRATLALEQQTRAGTPARPLPVTHPDEFGRLVTAFNGLLRAVGEREQRLRISEAALQAISQGVLITGPDRLIRAANPAFLAITGYALDEVMGRNCAFLQGAGTQPETIAHIRAALAAGERFSGEILNYRRDGEPFWNELTIAPLRDDGGAITHFVGITRDVTERHRGEEARRISATAFESQEGIFVTDADRVILRVNSAFTRITGYTEDEAVGQTPRLLSSGRHDPAFYSEMWRSIREHGTWQGEIWNRRKNGELFPESITITAVRDGAGQTTHYVANFIDISARKTAEDAVRTLAFYDPLTQLPNRRLLSDRLGQALLAAQRHQDHGALFFVDLDNFKALNDTRGHHLGDQLLEQVAQRLRAAVREADTVARQGGDEFVVLVEGLDADPMAAIREAERLGQKLLAAFQAPYALEGGDFHCTASIGVTLIGDRAEAVDEPLKRADLAMYQAKAAGRNALRFFDPAAQALVATRVALEERLRLALTQGGFALHFQPLVAADGTLTGAEALIRWQDPLRGAVSPADFIPLAEETGLIVPIGRWVLDEACRTLAAWAQQPALAGLTLSVNVSARQFQHADFIADVRGALERHDADPAHLKLELTESVLAERIDELIAKMDVLQTQGVRFSLDDFGTGYSSLAYLKRLPIEELKIDRSFVRDVLVDPNDAAIAEMVLALAGALGLRVVAEGVETEPQRAFLAARGCHVFQGYLFSRPLAADGFRLWVQARPAL